MLTICLCTWMLPIQLYCHMAGVDMLSLASLWLIKFTTSSLYEKVLAFLCLLLVIYFDPVPFFLVVYIASDELVIAVLLLYRQKIVALFLELSSIMHAALGLLLLQGH